MELSEIIGGVSEQDFYWVEPGLTSEQIDWYLSDLPFRLPEEAYELYLLCDGIEGEECYLLNLSVATEKYREWYSYKKVERREIELQLLPIFVEDDRCYAIQVTAEIVEESLVFEVMHGEAHDAATIAFQNLKEMLVDRYGLRSQEE